MGKARISLILLVFILLAAAILPVALPSSFYQQKLGDLLKRMTHGGFQAGEIHFSYNPAPVLELENVVIDNDPAIGQIERVTIPISFYNLFHGRTSLRGIVVSGAQFSPNFAIQLPERLRPEADTPRLADLQLTKSTVKIGSQTLGPVDGKIRFDENGKLAELLVTDNSGHLEFQIEPKNDLFALTLTATNWELPFGYPVRFESLMLKGVANSAGIVIEDIRGDLYGGIVTGNAQVGWNDGWLLSGTIRTNSIQSEPLSMVFSPVTHVSGRAEGEANFVYKSTDYRKLFDTPGIDAKLQVRDGFLHNFDLVTPLKSQTAGTFERGGQTRFDTLRTNVAVRGQQTQFSGVQIVGGKFSANGNLAIGEGQKLNGFFSARLSSGPISIGNQIRVGGALKTPVLTTGNVVRSRAEEPAPALAASEVAAEH